MTGDWGPQSPYPGESSGVGPQPADGASPGSPVPPAAPHALLGTGLQSFQAKFVSSGIATRMRVDVHEGWLAITGVMLPRRWRKMVQVALFVTVFIMTVDLIVVRPLWSPQMFAVLAAALLAFLIIVFVAEHPARVVSLVVPIGQVRFAAPESTVESLGGKKKVVTLIGPFAGEWSANGMIKLMFAAEGDAQGLIAALTGAAAKYGVPPQVPMETPPADPYGGPPAAPPAAPTPGAPSGTPYYGPSGDRTLR